LQDTAGGHIELINRFLLRNVISRAKTVRFIIPLTHSQIKNNRGSTIKEQLKTVSSICKSSLKELDTAIQPVITKCSPNDLQFDIEILSDTLQNQFIEIINSEKMSVEQDK